MCHTWQNTLARLIPADRVVGMIIPILVWRSPKGRCYGNQLNLGAVCRRRQERPVPAGILHPTHGHRRLFDSVGPGTAAGRLVGCQPTSVPYKTPFRDVLRSISWAVSDCDSNRLVTRFGMMELKWCLASLTQILFGLILDDIDLGSIAPSHVVEHQLAFPNVSVLISQDQQLNQIWGKTKASPKFTKID